MMAEMMKGMTGGRGGEMNPMIMMALLNGGNGGFMNMFDGLFNTTAPAAPAVDANATNGGEQ